MVDPQCKPGLLAVIHNLLLYERHRGAFSKRNLEVVVAPLVAHVQGTKACCRSTTSIYEVKGNKISVQIQLQLDLDESAHMRNLGQTHVQVQAHALVRPAIASRNSARNSERDECELIYRDCG